MPAPHLPRALVPCLAALVLIALASAGCEPSFLNALVADLSLSPPTVSRVVWVGHPTSVTLTISNTSRVDLDLEAPVLGDAATLLGAQVLNAPAFVGSAQSVPLEIALSPGVATSGLAVELSVELTPVDDEVPPVSALLSVEVRTPPPCEPRDPCESATFDPVLGECVKSAHPDGESCSDGSACTEEDRCSSGLCVGRAVTCADSVDCTVDTCDPTRGCVFEPVHERCEDDNPCTTDTCAPESGCSRAVVDDGTPCGPFSCTQLETCFYGVCVAAPTPDGFPCEDGDLCTAGDSCQAQECVSGTQVVPTAQAPAHIARPTVHVEPEIRWTQDESFTVLPAEPPPDSEPDPQQPPPPDVPAQVPAAFDTTLRFGEAMDLAQGLVGFRPTLVVLWKSEPFGLNGRACTPWDLWSYPRAADDAAFCATAVVATFFDEGELARDEGGTSVVLALAYGTVDGAFARNTEEDELYGDAPTDLLTAVLAESTYYPRPDSGRELWLHHVQLQLSTRSVRSAQREVHYSGPRWEAELNVHAGLRVAEEDGVPAILGWDLPRWPYTAGTDGPDGPDGSADRESGESESGAAAMPWLEVSLDRALITAPAAPNEYGSISWSGMLYDQCMEMPLAREELAWRDVASFFHQGAPWTLVRHDANSSYSSGCGEYVEPTTASLFGTSPFTDEVPWIALGDDVLSVSITPRGESLAMVRPFLCTDLEADCPPLTLQVLTPPLDNLDPVVSSWSIGVGDLTTTHVGALSLEPHFGAQGAVIVEHDTLGEAHVRLVDAVDSAAPIVLSSEAMHLADRRARALRSPLSAQSVYAVVTETAAPPIEDPTATPTEGSVVRFGCPFPSFPSIVQP